MINIPNSLSIFFIALTRIKPIMLICFFSWLTSFSCENTFSSSSPDERSELIFISNEGNFGEGNGSISVFKNDEKIQTVENIGDVVQSILVHENFLFVAINGSSEIKRYVISQSGLKMPGITISTNNSGPREMVILNNRLYFTNWISKDIKILNLTTYVIESKIKLDGLPEDIITDGNYLYTSIPHISLYDQGNGTNVIKIDPSNNTIIDSFDVGRGPQHLLINGENLFISRTYYSDDWYQVFFAATKVNLIDNDIIKTEYQSGIVCGGSIMKIEDMVYRTYNGGVAQIDENSLNIRSSSRIGDYPISSLYSAASLEQHLYFGITNDYEFPDTVFIHNISNSDIKFYEVGASPGDYSIWIED